MDLDFFAFPAVILAFITASILIISWDWRISIAALSVQYLSVFMLVSLSWPPEISVVKVVAGWIAGTVLGLAILNSPDQYARRSPLTLSEIVFRVMAVILAGLFAYTGGAKLIAIMSEISLQQAQGGMVLISLGLLHLGLTNHPLKVIIGLLTVLSGFEILYSAVESSILVTGLLASVTLGLAVVGAYLLTAPTLEEPS
jgi:hypothetical protein